jgi:uncharacterized protein
VGGTKSGGLQARDTNIRKYGADYYKRIGAIGGSKGTTGGFASEEVGADGLTGRQRARIAAAKGGRISRRGKAVNGY